MKKKYVSLKIEVVQVQLSDCIAGSNYVRGGTSMVREVDCTESGSSKATFSTW